MPENNTIIKSLYITPKLGEITPFPAFLFDELSKAPRLKDPLVSHPPILRMSCCKGREIKRKKLCFALEQCGQTGLNVYQSAVLGRTTLTVPTNHIISRA